jgi:hypothetical protein
MPQFAGPFLAKLVLLKYNHRGHREDINLQEVKRIFIPSVPSSCLTSLSLLLTDLHKKKSPTPILSQAQINKWDPSCALS